VKPRPLPFASLRTPALPGFGVLGFAKVAESPEWLPAKSTLGFDLSQLVCRIPLPAPAAFGSPFERVQMGSNLNAVGPNSRLPREPFERVQMATRVRLEHPVLAGGSAMPPTK